MTAPMTMISRCARAVGLVVGLRCVGVGVGAIVGQAGCSLMFRLCKTSLFLPSWALLCVVHHLGDDSRHRLVGSRGVARAGRIGYLVTPFGDLGVLACLVLIQRPISCVSFTELLN